MTPDMIPSSPSIEQSLLLFGLMAGLILMFNHLVRLRRMAMLHRTIRDAINNDSAAVSALVEKLEEKGGDDSRTGLILLALAAALIGFAWVSGDWASIRRMTGIAIFPGLVGAALMARHWWTSRQEARSDR